MLTRRSGKFGEFRMTRIFRTDDNGIQFLCQQFIIVCIIRYAPVHGVRAHALRVLIGDADHLDIIPLQHAK
ncbi:hypothetical protein D3C76_1715290 [compost metagenome]